MKIIKELKEFNQTLEVIANIPDKFRLSSKPFIKWAGGKHSLLPVLKNNMPKMYNNYFEPFLGGGALFFSLSPLNAFLSDINSELIITYLHVKKNLKKLVAKLKIFKNNHCHEYYYKTRGLEKMDSLTGAAKFIYLNKTCYNGLYRVNSNGIFNVPIGKYKNPLILDEKTLGECSRILKNAKIECKDYKDITPTRKDFVYFDPPYSDCFDAYSHQGFTQDNQRELSDFCKVIDKQGCFFMLSNSDNDFIRKMYKGFNFVSVENIRSINRNGDKRGKIKEILIKNYV